MKTTKTSGLQVAAFLTGALLAGQATAVPVSITSSSLTGRALDSSSGASGPISANTVSGTTLPGSAGLVVSQGSSVSTSSLNITGTVGGASIDLVFDHVRGGNVNAFAQTFGRIEFTALQDTTFSIFGRYAMAGPPSITNFQAHLEDLTVPSTLFRDVTQSNSTANASFLMGVVGDGDFDNVNVGNSSGSLVAGRSYAFSYASFVQRQTVIDGGAVGAGCLSLVFGSAALPSTCATTASVPETAVRTLLGLGLAMAWFLRRRWMYGAI